MKALAATVVLATSVAACIGAHAPPPSAPVRRAPPLIRADSGVVHMTPELVVLGLITDDWHSSSNGENCQVCPIARDLSMRLRHEALEDGHVRLGADREGIDELILARCHTDDLDCLTHIAEDVPTDRVLYGVVADHGAGIEVILEVRDNQTGERHQWIHVIEGIADVAAVARQGYQALLGAGR
jgi:hypothetical protein